MPAPLIGAVAPTLVGAAAGKLFGPKEQKTQSLVPQDLNPLRQQQTQLLQYLTGFGGPPAGLGGAPQGQPGGQPNNIFGKFLGATQGPMQGMGGPSTQNPNAGQVDFGGMGQVDPRTMSGGPNIGPNGAGGMGGQMGQMGRQPMSQQEWEAGRQQWLAGGGSESPQQPGMSQDAMAGFRNQLGGMGGQVGGMPSFQPQNNPGLGGANIGNYFGTLGVQQNPLQNTAAMSANRMLTQQSPEQRALEVSQPYVGQTGINNNAQNRLTQGMSQSGLNAGANNFLGNLLQQTPDLGPGQQAGNTLTNLSNTGGFDPNGPFGGILSQINAMSQGGGMGGGSGAEGFLQQMLAQNPGQANMNLLQPQFERALSMANQAGGRFGSANALMRSNAVTDQQAQLAQMLGQGTNQQLQAAGTLGQLSQAQRSSDLQARLQALGLGTNAMAQQAQNRLGAANSLGGFTQQGAISGLGAQQAGANSLNQFGLQDVGQQLNAAGTLGSQDLQGFQNLLQGLGLQGQLAGQAGNADRANTQQGFNMGTQLAGQNDVENQRRIQLLLGMLGQAQGAAFNVPTQTTPSGAQQGAALGGQIGNAITAMAPYLFGGGKSG